jgi:hypothetical protein
MFRLLLALFLLLTPLIARGDYREFRAVPVDAALGAKLTQVAVTTLKEFPKLISGNLALSVIESADYSNAVSFLAGVNLALRPPQVVAGDRQGRFQT